MFKKKDFKVDFIKQYGPATRNNKIHGTSLLKSQVESYPNIFQEQSKDMFIFDDCPALNKHQIENAENDFLLSEIPISLGTFSEIETVDYDEDNDSNIVFLSTKLFQDISFM